MSESEKKVPEVRSEAPELSDEALEQAAGGVIDGGCIPPTIPPCFPPPPDDSYVTTIA